jgi:predicted adenylyl cyclase CyaB
MRLNELEVKLQIESEIQFKDVFDICKKLFGSPVSHFTQLDEYYDTDNRQLKKQDLVVRIRSMNGTKTIALKSPRMELPSGLTNRIELEFATLEGDKVQQQLIQQGLQPYETQEKERWTFVYGDFEIVLDRLPFIGYFIEIEGSSENSIRDMIRKLKLSESQIVRKNYGELFKAKFQELNIPTQNMCVTFAKEAELSLKR